MKMKRTSNIQHPTPNTQLGENARNSGIGCWMFDVGCWIFFRRLFVCLALSAATIVFAQTPLKPRATPAKPAKAAVDPTKHDAERISVKFRDDLPVRLRQGKLAAEGANANALGAATGLLNRLDAAGAKWERHHSVAEEKLSEMREKAQRNTGKAMADLNTYYILRVPKGLKAEQLIDELNALEVVELAEPMPLPAPPPTAGNYQPQQGYLNAAPGGIDADYAWTQLAGQGGNVWITDIEFAWNLSHTDFNATLVGPAPSAAASTLANMNHGTAVLGEMASLNNGVGTTGIAYNSTLFVVTHSPNAGYNMANAVTTAANAMREGDILVLEVQTDGPAAGTTDYVPIEWESQATYDAIRNAAAAGTIVVEAAGNGSQNLDDPIFNTGHSPFRADHDSLAIIVGAGAVTAGGLADRSRLDFSSFGSTVDLQGWGEQVVTTGYGGLYSADGANSFYTSTFNGTSSATPIVAGACAVLQSHHKVTNVGAVLTPYEMREILRATGTPQVDGTEFRGGTYSQSGTTVTRASGVANFAGSDINSIIRFSGGQQGLITAMISATQVTVNTSQNVAATTMTFVRPATQNIGLRPNLRMAMQYVSGFRTWVHFAYFGTENGSFAQPFNTVPEGVSAVPSGGNLIFKVGASNWTGTVNKGMTMRAFGGDVTIGQ
jgi:hypothetical protein